ncbi:SEL1-like repeat protein [Aeromonas hydrophila]|uniref:SEL1-like repeat protein n=1 Tax=Aeromonas hydrophila TaxID=644 RepID=UPI002B46B6EA|nr:sel1 repeat family protein [Aeromonas hydrophila]
MKQSEENNSINALFQAAEDGDVIAQYKLGEIYDNGYGAEQSYSKALEWYGKAAEQGFAKAQYNLGVMHQKGQGTQQNNNIAAEWYRKAAEQGFVDAQFNLGLMYQEGKGVEKSNTKAAKWYRKAAKKGDAAAQYNLGCLYQRGKGVKKNNSKAAKWYRKAATQGDVDAQCNLGMMYRTGLGVEQSNSKAVKWYLKAAEQGDRIAELVMGLMYEEGKIIEQSDIKAVEWYHKAANKEDADAQCNLAWMYYEGRGVAQNYRTARKWLLKASKQGNASAFCNLGFMYIMGKGVKKDTRIAFNWFRKASRAGDPQGSINLGMMYMGGDGVKQSYARAQALFRKAARNAPSPLRFQAIELQDQTERFALSPHITDVRKRILEQLKVQAGSTMTHYTSLQVGNALLLEPSPLRLGHINALNDPNEGKLLWQYLGYVPVESKPVFVGCFLPDEDSLNMWRFYSKDHQKDDACGCAITFYTDSFFEFDLLSKKSAGAIQDAKNQAFINSGKSPQESAAFYRVVYIKDNEIQIHGEDIDESLQNLFDELTTAVNDFVGETPNMEKLQQLSWLLGPLPYLLKDADYEAEKEHRVIITHLEYGAKEIQVQEPDLVEGTSPRLYVEMHRANHLAQIKHVTLGPKSPNQEMMAPYWHQQLASKFPDQIKANPDFYIKNSRCAYQ